MFVNTKPRHVYTTGKCWLAAWIVTICCYGTTGPDGIVLTNVCCYKRYHGNSVKLYGALWNGIYNYGVYCVDFTVILDEKSNSILKIT
jgi:hypothetical protein